MLAGMAAAARIKGTGIVAVFCISDLNIAKTGK